MNTGRIIILIAITLFLSCKNNNIYEKNKEISEGVWNIKDAKKFDVNITDTASLYNFYINLRNTTDYSYCNIFLFLNTLYPDGKVVRDTVECFLADSKGKWNGKGIGKIKDNQFLLKPNLKFPRKGTYSFIFEQGMREENLKGIIDIGIKIEFIPN